MQHGVNIVTCRIQAMYTARSRLYGSMLSYCPPCIHTSHGKRQFSCTETAAIIKCNRPGGFFCLWSQLHHGFTCVHTAAQWDGWTLQRKTGWCGPLLDHVPHFVETWLSTEDKTELHIFLSVQSSLDSTVAFEPVSCLVLFSLHVGTWWICPVVSKHIRIVSYSSIYHLKWAAASMAFWGSFHLLQTGL